MKRTLGWGLAILFGVVMGATTATAGNWDDPFFDHPWSSHRLHRSFVDDAEPHSTFDLTLLGGFGALRHNAPALVDNVYSVPTTAMLGLRVNPNFALEGEVTLSVPVLQKIELGPNQLAQRKGPDLLLYQAGVRVSVPGDTYLLYVAGGAGMATFLVNAEPNRFPQISRVEDMPAFNAGVGAMFYLSPAWSVRLDFRQFALYPPTDSAELSPDGSGSTLWLQRAAVGLTYGHQPRVVHEERDPFFHSSW
jgi:hypothetical protein